MAPTQNEQTKISEIVQKVLNKKYVPLQIKNFGLKEDLENDKSLVTCELVHGKEKILVEGQGSGVVDALFCTIIDELNTQYSSLRNIQLIDFIMKVKPERNGIGSNGFVKIDLAVRNRRGNKTHFLHESRSIIGAVVQVVQKCIEYFINSELAIIQLKKSLQNAKERNRMDLVTKYTHMMSELVKNMPYNNILMEEK
tara:strand:+ start:768 stop:1358 length:591 start_codon:yes stop_codon:yes gene_type:complete